RSCLLCPRKRTCAVQLAMSAMGQKRTSGTEIPELFGVLGGEAFKYGLTAERQSNMKMFFEHRSQFRRRMNFTLFCLAVQMMNRQFIIEQPIAKFVRRTRDH